MIHNNLLASVLSRSGAASSEGAVTVDVDSTIFFQVGIIIVLLIVLKPLLFDPTLKLFEEREKRIDGAKKLARDTDKKSAAAESEFGTQMQKAQSAGNAERDRLRAEGMKIENEVLAKVRAETAQILEQGRRQTQTELTTARAQLKSETSTLGRTLASRALGRDI